jgi:hypothetical protein
MCPKSSSSPTMLDGSRVYDFTLQVKNQLDLHEGIKIERYQNVFPARSSYSDSTLSSLTDLRLALHCIGLIRGVLQGCSSGL